MHSNYDIIFDTIKNQYIKILLVNLGEDSFEIVKMNDTEKENKLGFSPTFSKWVKQFAENGSIYFDDLDDYLRATKIEYLRNYFKTNDRFSICYRRSVEDKIVWCMMDIVKTPNYSEGNEFVCLYITDISNTVFAMNTKGKAIEKRLYDVENKNTVLKSIANIYHSMHLLDLKNDTVKEIQSNPFVREYVNKNTDIDFQMRDAMTHLIVEDSIDSALKFTNVKTLVRRLENKNIISKDFLSVNVG